MALATNGKNAGSGKKLKARLAVRCMVRVAPDAGDPHAVVISEGVVGAPRSAVPPLFIIFTGGSRGLFQNRRVALGALLVAEGKPHPIGLDVPADKEFRRVNGSHGPHPAPHPRVGPAVAVDAPYRLLPMVGARQVAGDRSLEPVELLLVKVARNAKAVVLLDPGQPSEEDGGNNQQEA